MKSKFLKCIFLLLFITIVIPLSAQVGARLTLTITNITAVNFRQQVISIPWNAVISKYPAIDTGHFKVINRSTKKEMPFQLEYRGEPTIQNLLLQADVAARSSLEIDLVNGKPSSFVLKTYCRYVPERKDDFAWENDKIAFRMYGKALEGTSEDAYGMDVWVKRTDRLIINERYQRGEYHIDHGDGMDNYHVGHSLGAGNIAPFVNDSIWFSKNYHAWKVLDNGPLRSTFQLFYDEWDVAGKMVRVSKTISLDAGSQLSRIEASFSYNNNDSLPVVVGLIKRKDPGTMLLDEKNGGIMGYWEPGQGEAGNTGTGTIFLKPVVKMKVTNLHVLAQSVSTKDLPFVYYSGAAWDKAKDIRSANEWFAYLQSFRAQLLHPLQVKLK